MQAGKLRHFVELQAQTTVRGADFADPQLVWTTVATVPASIEPLRGREYMAQREEQSALEVRVRVRWRSDLSDQMRVKHGSTVYEIASVIDVGGRAREVELMCRRQR
jgi:SPP1 family predicted phage head-tail adaptor